MISNVISANLNQRPNTFIGRPDNKPIETASKTLPASLSSENSQKLVKEKLVESIDKVLQKNRTSKARSIEPQNYTPKAVSDHILNYIQNAVNRAESRGENRNAVLSQTRQGINNGFRDAKNILSSLNTLSGKIAENVQKTFDLIQDGLGEFEPSTTIKQNAYSAAQQESSSQTLELSVTTKGGDVVTVNFQKNQSSNFNQAQIFANNNNNNISTSEFSSTSRSQFSFTVQGNLDPDESIAIEALFNDSKNIVKQFFNGNVDAAFETGFSLGFDSSELTGFSLNLNQNQSSTQAYREISGFSDYNDNSRPPVDLENLLKPILSFSQSLGATISDTANSGLFGNDAVEKIFAFFARSETENQSVIEQLESLSGKTFDEIASDIISKIKI